MEVKGQKSKQAEGRRPKAAGPRQFSPYRLPLVVYSLSGSVLSPQPSVLLSTLATRNLRIVLALLWIFLTPVIASAQMSGSGWTVSLYGTVQVEPGSDVATLAVKDEKIRFAIQNVHCSDRNFSTGRFMSDVTRKDPGLQIKGPEEWLEMLINERPNKRVLQMNGVYYPDSRMFVIHKLVRFGGAPGPRQ